MKETMGRLLDEGGRALSAAGFETPRLDAELLLAHVLGWDRTRLLAHAADSPGPGVRPRFDDLLARRLAGEPVAYIRGVKEFYGAPFLVTPDVLIPRPETELLVEAAVEWLRGSGLGKPVVVDVGTGSGCLAITVARLWPAAEVWGTDSSPEAIEVARKNGERLGVGERVRWRYGNLLEPLPADLRIDLLLANLPYVPSGEWDRLPQGVRKEPRRALDGGEDGLDLIRELLARAACRMSGRHALLLEVGPGQAGRIGALEETVRGRYEVVMVRNDLLGIERVVQLEVKP